MIIALAFGFACLLLLGIWGAILAGETGRERARRWRMGLRELQGFLLHPGLFYHPGHTWIMPQENGMVRIGLDDFGGRLVGGIRKVDLPAQGSAVRQGQPVVQLDCGKKRAKLLSPVDGVVTAVNEALAREGSPLRRDPYGKGWLFAAEVSDRSFTNLPTGSAAMEWLRREADRLSVFLHEELGVTLADGGDLIPDPPRVLSEDQWQNLVSAFFHAAANGGERPGAGTA